MTTTTEERDVQPATADAGKAARPSHFVDQPVRDARGGNRPARPHLDESAKSAIAAALFAMDEAQPCK